LKQHFYPIDDCIKIVREFKVEEAEAYLLERSGAVHDALELQLSIFEKKLKALISNIREMKKYRGEKQIFA